MTSSSKLELWGRWVTANVTGELVGLGAAAAIGYTAARALGVTGGGADPGTLWAATLFMVLAGALAGAVLGYTQSTVLRDVFELKARHWVIATAVAGALSWMLGLVFGTFVAPALWQVAPWAAAALSFIVLLSAGAILGLAQFAVLRPAYPGSTGWVPINILGWGVALIVGVAGFATIGPDRSRLLALATGAITVAAVGAIAGSITGAYLVKLASRQAPREPVGA